MFSWQYSQIALMSLFYFILEIAQVLYIELGLLEIYEIYIYGRKKRQSFPYLIEGRNF